MHARLRPVAATFAVFGVFLGTWAVVVADVEHALGVSHGGFGAVLALALCLSAAVNVLTGSLVERWGTSVLLRGSLLAWAAALVGMAAAGSTPVLLAVAIVATIAVGGSVDVGANVAATAALSDQPGRLVRFHATFNVGAATGAAATGLALHFGASWRVVLLVPAVLAVAIVVASRGVDLPAGDAGEAHGPFHALTIVYRSGLVLVALIFAGGAMVEGGIDTWGVAVLREQLAVSVAVGAGAYVLGQSVATLGRVFLGPLAGRFGAARGVGVGAGLAAAGLALVALAPAPLAVTGLVLAAAGVSVCWPLLIAYASEGLARPGPVVGGITAVGYLGLVIGPPLVGGLADVVGLRPALLALTAVAALVAVGPSLLRRPAPVSFAAGPAPPSAPPGP